jgi:hypothetical protein
MTITPMDRSEGDVLGFAVSGEVTTSDYEILTPAVEAAVDAHGSVKLLLDLTAFHREKVGAWGADLHFGHAYHHKIQRMAIVGDRAWERHLAHLCTPFYAREAEYFDNDDDAWAWLEG